MKDKRIKRILIATGIYPPDVGGPAQYAYELAKVWRQSGLTVDVKYFSLEKKLPTGIRHLFFLLKSLRAILRADYILVLDTWSAALPTALGAMILGKRFVIRTGGDFLWESYVERTKEKILLSEFYKTKRNFSNKERFVFRITSWILKRASKIVFSTDWQRQIWALPYDLDLAKTAVIENYFGEKISSENYKSKSFLGATRKLVWKNLDSLEGAFRGLDAKLDLATSSHEVFLERMKQCYGVILVSLGDISPNMILDAVRCSKPFIVTREIGIYDRIKDIGVFVDPLNTEDIKEKVLWLLNEENYKNQRSLVEKFSFTHSWQQIGEELLNIKQ
ncbi:MAG: hypothetical protein V4438_03070 [Patescibacteria group bacterium]